MGSLADPKPGFYKRRLVKAGPWVTVRITIEDGVLAAEVDGETVRANGQPFDAWEMAVTSRPIDEAEFRFLTRTREWAVKHAPHMPQARPRDPIRLDQLPARRRP